ncbi:hypothetical protein IMY05_C4627000300 [Salix suchowensis]|nr:hypothetical protein IMY05_C4627000300 [Salix suchowensis]
MAPTGSQSSQMNRFCWLSMEIHLRVLDSVESSRAVSSRIRNNARTDSGRTTRSRKGSQRTQAALSPTKALRPYALSYAINVPSRIIESQVLNISTNLKENDSLIPTLVLAFVSFACSAFVILRIVIPILPPHPLSKRVAPAEFGLPNFRSLSAADKSHIWLASFDILAIGIFVWQAVNEHIGGPTSMGVAEDPLSAVRLWFALTVRQTCLLVVAGLTLLHVRMGRSVSFGAKHWILWSPTVLLILTSTALVGVLAGAGMDTLFLGLLAYSMFMTRGRLLAREKRSHALRSPRRRLTHFVMALLGLPLTQAQARDIILSRLGPFPPTTPLLHLLSMDTLVTQELRRTLRFPQSPRIGSDHRPSLLMSPCPALPSPYGPLSPTAEALGDPDPFRRIPTPLPEHPRQRFGSQTSWLTSVDGSQPTLSAWSFPASSVHEGTIA